MATPPMKSSDPLTQSLSDIRDRMAACKYADEAKLADELAARYLGTGLDRSRAEDMAERLVLDVRGRRTEQSVLDAFMQEFGLSNSEGVALMCLAEALLRVPDGDTADELIADKMLAGNWSEHSGGSDSLFVNASTWALMLTGNVISLEQVVIRNPADWFKKLVGKVGEPVIRRAMFQAMKILGGEFVLGQKVDEAIARGSKEFGEDTLFSFDMLGEGARTDGVAGKCYEAYTNAIDGVALFNRGKDKVSGSSISVKLSALHPRYEFSQRERVLKTLGERLAKLCQKAAKANICLTIDAEEVDRLELSLDLFEQLARDPELDGWNGLGLVVQAYGKRSLATVEWVTRLAEETGQRFMVRLVKGAYWDAEVKHAQELGLSDFAVFTRKASSDLCFLVCAQALLDRRDVIYCQFATHNAHSIAAIMEMAGEARDFEFQRLHGMGELLYKVSAQSYDDFPNVRIYAPVGGHEELLAYLVRRLLENGANSSFVNRFMDANTPARDVVCDPLTVLEAQTQKRHSSLRMPQDLFDGERQNSAGIDLNCAVSVAALNLELARYSGESYISAAIVGGEFATGEEKPVRNPARGDDIVGHVAEASGADIDRAFELAKAGQGAWDQRGGSERAEILIRAGDLLQERQVQFMSLLIREAGKTLADAIAEVREAIDFCRYYGQQASKNFGEPLRMPGPTGETNHLSLHGRGIFVCISPWNFPLAIFLGQVTAALAAGNAVMAKPAEQTPLVGAEAVKLLHEAGVPRDVLHLVPGDGPTVGAALISHLGTTGVAFTGSTETAKRINLGLAQRDGPIVPLIAETGGQNVMLVDSTALLEQVTDDVIGSAFTSAGQRCSALRVLYLQEDIADQAIAMICGAMDKLVVGDPAKLSSDVGPIIDTAAAQDLQAHIDDLTSRSSTSHHVKLQPECGNGSFVAPHLFEIGCIAELTKEHFGPILHVIRYATKDLDKLLGEIARTGFGLTFGIHSRIEGRARDICQRLPVGNAYINRNMVGAVVGVQPFGGQGLSGTGPKAGGPRYLFRFATEKTLTVNTMASGGNIELLSAKS